MSALAGPGIAALHSSRGAAFGDFDNDGDIDILVMNMNEPPSLLRNDLKSANHWLRVKLEGRQSNRGAMGALVTVEAGGRRQSAPVLSQSSYLSQSDFRLHFGLGAAARDLAPDRARHGTYTQSDRAGRADAALPGPAGTPSAGSARASRSRPSTGLIEPRLRRSRSV